MSGGEHVSSQVDVNGQPCRIWKKGSGRPVYVLPGFGGLPKWTPFLDRLAERRMAVLASPPGFPGSLGHDRLDSHLDWIIATLDLLKGAGLGQEPVDLVGLGVGGALAAEVAAVWPHKVRRLALVAPHGLYDPGEPTADVFAQRPPDLPGILCADPTRWTELKAAPPGANSVEWPIEQVRASEAAARLLWPLGDTRLSRRLPRIICPTLLAWGTADKVIPFSYAERFVDAIAGKTEIRRIEGAGHLADLDKPDELAETILAFMD